MNEQRGVRIAIGLGSNLGDREAYLRFGREHLAQKGVTWIAISSLYETEPIGPIAQQPPFLNQAAVGETDLPAHTLLQVCQEIEQEAGRDRSDSAHRVRWGPRTLDLDILLYGDREIREADLSVPHPEMKQRAFVLIPLAEIAPKMRIPGTNGIMSDRAQLAPQREGVRVWRSSATKPLTQAG